jgi:hypothetical protein
MVVFLALPRLLQIGVRRHPRDLIVWVDLLATGFFVDRPLVSRYAWDPQDREDVLAVRHASLGHNAEVVASAGLGLADKRRQRIDCRDV